MMKKVALAFASLLFVLGLFFANATAQLKGCNPWCVFQPIEARQDPKDFSEIINKAEKVSAEAKAGLNTALHNYQKAPTMATAIGVLQYFSSAFHEMSVEKRAALFQADPALFLSVDIAKYEIVMHVREEVGARLSRRVGSSGLHEVAIMEWVAAGRPLDKIRKLLDPTKQFYSDDDITNLTKELTLLADEKVNGAEAVNKYIEITRRWGNALDPKVVQTEFLSPTEAWAVIRSKHPTEIPALPDYLFAWTASNPEKYNDPFGVFMLDFWGFDKGVVTKDVADPMGSTVPFKDFYPARDGPPPSSKFAFIAGNYRQIYDVHHGGFKSQCKYLGRMIYAWELVHGGAGLPAGWQDTYKRAQAIYEKGENIEGAAEFKTQIKDIIRNVVKTTHEYQMDRVETELEKVYGELKDKENLTAADFESHKELVEELNGLAVAYANVSKEMHTELMMQFRERIQKGEQSEKALEIFQSHAFKYIMEIVQERSDYERGNIEAFSTIREEISKNLSEGLTAVNLDRFLEEVAIGRFKKTYLKLGGFGVVREEYQVDPQTALRHIKLIRAISEAFFESNKQYAITVYEYCNTKDGPGMAIEMLQKLSRVFDSSKARSVSTSYVDEHGNRLSGEVVPSGISLGIKVFGASVKGAEWWGHAQNGAELYKNLHKWLYESGASSDLEVGQAQAALLINSINFHNLMASKLGREQWKVPMSGVLSSNTAGVLVGNAGGIGIDRKATDELAYAALKDLVIMYQPHMAAVIVLIDLGKWGYKEWTLGSERNLLVQAMMENGVWEPANIKEMADPTKFKDDQLPKLKGIRSEENGIVWEPEHIARYEFSKMILRDTKVELNPRETLLDIAYDSGYIESDPILSTSVDAINEMSGSWAAQFFHLAKLPSNSRGWGRDAVDKLGITIDHSDDDKSSPVLISQVHLGSSHPDSGLSGPQLRLMGYLVSDFWVKRQKIIEEAVLPGIIKEASRRWLAKLRAEKLEIGATSFLDEVKDINFQLKEVDRKMWARTARAAFPSAYPAPRDTYDPDRDGTPIRDAFMNERRVKTIVDHLQTIQDIVDTGRDPQGAQANPQGGGAMPRTRQDVINQGKDELQELRDLAFKWGDAYEKVRGVLDEGESFVKEGKLELRPIYLRLSPGSWSLSELTSAAGGDLAKAKSWLDNYQLARKRVLKDIEEKAKDAPPSSPVGVLHAEVSTFLNSLVNNVDTKHTYSPAHPLWPKLIRLRYQIQSIDSLQSYTGPITPDDFRAALAPMTIKGDEHVNPQDSDTGDSAARSVFLVKTKDKMNEEYDRLLETLKNQFEIKIAVNPNKPYIGQEAELTSKAILSPDLPTPKLRTDGFPDYVAKFRWTIYDKGTGAEPVSSVETADAKYMATITRSADYAVKVWALDGGGNVVAKGNYDGPIAEQLLVWGNVDVGEGDYDGEPITVTVGPLKEEGAKLGGFSLELKDYNEAIWKGIGTKGQATVVIGGRTFYSNVSEVEADPKTGLIKLKEDLHIAMPYNVSVNVTVLDKSKQPVNGAAVEVMSNGGAGRPTSGSTGGTSSKIKLAPGDSIVAVAKYQPFGFRLFTNQVNFNPLQGRAIELKAELPMFDTGHLIVSGRFVPDASINPAPKLTGGQITSNIGTEGVMDPGAFSFSNDRPINLESSQQFEATASITDGNGKRYLPKGGKITKGFGDSGHLDLGQIEVARLGLTVKPQVELLDWTGRAIKPAAGRSQVLINGVPAASNGDAYSGEYTFTDDNEQIMIEGDLEMPGGSHSTIQQKISAREFGGIGASSPQSPNYSIKLPIYLPGSLRVTGRTRIDGVPTDRSAPGLVSLTDPLHGLVNAPPSNTPFEFTFPLPVYLTENVTILATAKDADIGYNGSISVKAPDGAASLDVGEIVLSSGRDTAEKPPVVEEIPEGTIAGNKSKPPVVEEIPEINSLPEPGKEPPGGARPQVEEIPGSSPSLRSDTKPAVEEATQNGGNQAENKKEKQPKTGPSTSEKIGSALGSFLRGIMAPKLGEQPPPNPPQNPPQNPPPTTGESNPPAGSGGEVSRSSEAPDISGLYSLTVTVQERTAVYSMTVTRKGPTSWEGIITVLSDQHPDGYIDLRRQPEQVPFSYTGPGLLTSGGLTAYGGFLSGTKVIYDGSSLTWAAYSIVGAPPSVTFRRTQ